MIRRGLIGLLLLLPLALNVSAAELVRKASPHDVKGTMDKLEQIVKKKGLTVFARIDHAGGAKKVGMTLPPAEVLIFGNPKMGTLIMQSDIRAGLDLPLRVLIYQDADGETWITYHNPQSLKKSYEVGKVKALNKAEGALDKLTSAAAK
jgi:uncharacterized protein (DUF302 family)